jgi:hypothetical protein
MVEHAINAGNYSPTAPTARVAGVVPGFDLCSFFGSVGINSAPATSWEIVNARDEKAAFVASAASPIWLVATYFDLGSVFQGTVGDRLKVATTLADAAAYTATSLPVDSGGFLQVQDNICCTAEPFVFTKFTANFSLKLWLHNNNGAPTGTGLQPMITAPAVVVTPAPIPVPTVRVPVRIEYLVRSEAPDSVDISPAMQRLDLGIPMY